MLGNRRWGTLLSLTLMLALALGLGCRRELPELFDRNQAPQTYITAAPVESLFDGFQVDLSWYGLDPDGEIAYFLWAWTDSSRAYYAAWNPETNVDDRAFQDGLWDATHLTTRTDSTFTIQTNDEGGTARDVTFNVTAVDDQGKRDPLPARLYFFGSVDQRPEIIWLDEPPETLNVGEVFQCRFTGATENGYILGYQWTSGSSTRYEPRNMYCDPIWTFQIAEDCEPDSSYCEDEYGDPLYYCHYADSTTITLTFEHDVEKYQQYYKYGAFLIKARCQDLAGVESQVSTNPDNLEGVLIPILNRDPDTRLRPYNAEAGDYPVLVRYKEDPNDPYIEYGVNAVHVDTLHDGSPAPAGFHYALADTLPWGEQTWVRFFWQGWDTDNPMIAVEPDQAAPGDSIIKTLFQTSYAWKTLNLRTNYPFSATSDGLYPDGGQLGLQEDLEFGDTVYGEAGADFEMNVAVPADYVVNGYCKDYFDRIDGTPATVTFTGGFASFADSVVLGTVGSTESINLTALPPGDPVRIFLKGHPGPMAHPDSLFLWDPQWRMVTMHPTEIVGNFPAGTNEYTIALTVYGHDDPRNGAEASLARFFWNLIDPDFAHPSYQFVDNTYYVDDGSTVLFWTDVIESTDPPPEGAYTVLLKVIDSMENIQWSPTPEYLGHKTFSGKFTNTPASKVVTGFIEDEEQLTTGLNTIGRVGYPTEAEIDIRYKPVFLP